MPVVHFADRLTARIRATSPVCVGLDPVLQKLPRALRPGPGADREAQAAAVTRFCIGIIDAVSSVAAAVKPNLAFFEAIGWQGVKAFEEVSGYAHAKGCIVIADGKRGDIGSTAEAYAQAYLGDETPCDALTVNPYLGSDSVLPFRELATKSEKGLFVLVKTSNPSSGELQDLHAGDEVVHEHLAQLVESWAMDCLGSQTNLSCVGAVVGATYPEELAYLRTLMPHCILLLPGYGAQGARAEDVKRGFLGDGTGAIVSASRNIIYASEGPSWQEAARTATEHMAQDIARALSS